MAITNVTHDALTTLGTNLEHATALADLLQGDGTIHENDQINTMQRCASLLWSQLRLAEEAFAQLTGGAAS